MVMTLIGGILLYFTFNGKVVKMCKPCETSLHKYFQYLEKITEDSPKPFKYESR